MIWVKWAWWSNAEAYKKVQNFYNNPYIIHAKASLTKGMVQVDSIGPIHKNAI